jgi:hypothetical protein
LSEPESRPEIIMPAVRPTRVAIIQPPDYGFVPTDKDIPLEIQGETNDLTPQTSMLIRVFYRINGIPVAAVLYNGRAKDTNGVPAGANPAIPGTFVIDPVPAKLKSFQPTTTDFHTLRVLAWDHKTKIVNPETEVRSKLSRFQGIASA